MKLMPWFGRLAASPAVLFIVTFGVVERALRAILNPARAVGEAFNVAAALAAGRGFADAYLPGQGPTAHVLPISPAIAGAVYAVFGTASATSEFLLATWSIGLAIGTYMLLFRAFDRLGSPRAARLLALAAGCLIPSYMITLESIEFRVWEGGLAAFLGALFLERLLALHEQQTISMRAIAGMCLLAALLFFVNPVLGVGAYACAGCACWQLLDTRRILAAIGLAVCTLAIFVVPWALRNNAVLGAPVALRSNFGLELAIANYAGALDPVDPSERYRARLDAIHPFDSDAAYQAMRAAGGEVAYSANLQHATWQWISANPGEELRIVLHHVRDAFLPEQWQFRFFGPGPLISTVSALLASLASVLGLSAIGWALLTRRPHWVYPALMVLLPGLSVSLFQPVPRYTYLFYPVLLFCSADVVLQVFAVVGKRMASSRYRPAASSSASSLS